jgi:hypothetical protein
MDDLLEKIAVAAREFTNENIRYPTDSDYLIIENAMLMASTITLQEQLELTEVARSPWKVGINDANELH